MNKNIIALIVAVLFGTGGIYGGYYTLKAKAEEVDKRVSKVEDKQEKFEDCMVEQKEFNVEQRMDMKYMKALMEKIDRKVSSGD